MTRKTFLPLIAVAAATVVPTTAALAASSGATVPATATATATSVKIQSGYAYYDSFKPSNKRLIVVVVKTKGQLPRRFDGLVRAGGTFAKQRGGSMGSVGGRASRCYTFTVPLKDGRFYPADGSSGTGPKASPGRYTVTVSAKDADGKTVSSGKTITLRDRKTGDRSGKPLGC